MTAQGYSFGAYLAAHIEAQNAEYVMISPVVGTLKTFLSIFNTFADQVYRSQRVRVVSGDSDVFTSAESYERWARPYTACNPAFTYTSIPGAGHFYHETGTLQHLLGVILSN